MIPTSGSAAGIIPFARRRGAGGGGEGGCKKKEKSGGRGWKFTRLALILPFQTDFALGSAEEGCVIKRSARGIFFFLSLCFPGRDIKGPRDFAFAAAAAADFFLIARARAGGGSWKRFVSCGGGFPFFLFGWGLSV